METLQRLRTEKGLSQARLAARAELDPSTVNQIERGAREASPATLRKLADALDVSIAGLLEDTSPKAQSPLPEAEQRAARRHEGLVGIYEATTQLTRNVTASFKNFTEADLERLATLHTLRASLAKLHRPRTIWGDDPEDLAEAIDQLEEAERYLLIALEEHADLVPSETRGALDESLNELLKDRAGAK